MKVEASLDGKKWIYVGSLDELAGFIEGVDVAVFAGRWEVRVRKVEE